MGRALDMILTGRAVPADEALAFGLVNRVVDPGTARAAAEDLARQIAAFPQTCLRNDRKSVHAQHGLGEAEAMSLEAGLGLEWLHRDGIKGAAGFAAEAGRHGAFD